MPYSAARVPSRLIAPWRVRDPLYILLWTYLGLFVLALAVYLTTELGAVVQGNPTSSADEAWRVQLSWWFDGLLAVQYLLMALFMSAWLFRRHAVRLARLFPPARKTDDLRYAIGLLLRCAAVSAVLVAMIVCGLMLAERLMHQPAGVFVEGYAGSLQSESEMVLHGAGSATPSWFRVLLLTLIGPAVEELLFRAGLYGALRKRLNPWPANVASSVVFALSHPYVLGLPNVLLISTVSAHAYERTRSMWTPILFHMLWNTCCAASLRPVLWIPVAGLLAAMAWLELRSRWT
jgi:membrane protease YdiL (CAAX protease family)